MEQIFYFLGQYIRFVSFFSTNKAASISFRLFQKTQAKKLSKTEIDFYKKADYFELETAVERVKVYELGSDNKQLVFLVHGWNSNAGSMGTIAQELAKSGFHCILFDLPGHEHSSLSYSNLKLCKQVFQAVLKKVKQDAPIHVIAHSFGSAVSAYALSELNIKVDRLIYLTCPNTLDELFQVLKSRLRLSPIVYSKVIDHAENLLEEKISEITVLKKTELISYNQLSLFHDVYDKILPIEYSKLLDENLKHTRLYSYERIGHYRMLSNEELIRDLLENMTTTKKVSQEAILA